jgi:hypothetical protein
MFPKTESEIILHVAAGNTQKGRSDGVLEFINFSKDGRISHKDFDSALDKLNQSFRTFTIKYMKKRFNLPEDKELRKNTIKFR